MPSKANRIASIGLMGHGAFGRLITEHLAPHLPLVVFDTMPGAIPDHPGGRIRAGDIVAVARCDIVILAVPVAEMPAAVAALRPHLRPGSIVVDVGSVKLLPARVMTEGLPSFVDIVGTHPLFGPQSAQAGIAGHKIAVCPIRGDAAPRIAAFLRRVLGLVVYVTTPEAHDREAAVVQGLTHLIAKVLFHMEPLPTRLTTASFERLVEAAEMVRHDAPGVFLAIERDNPFAAEIRDRFFSLAEQARAELVAGEAHQTVSCADGMP